MNRETKNKQLIELAKRLTSRQKVVFSDQGNLLSVNHIDNWSQPKVAKEKPNGLWYSSGSSWIRYLTDDFETLGEDWEQVRLSGYTHVYQFSLIRKHILQIKTKGQMVRFCEKYALKNEYLIRWEQVDKDGWYGIEIDYCNELYKDALWLWDWSCSSGCIWDRRAVRRIKLLACWEMTFRGGVK